MSLITPDYCITMARYNRWQNRQIQDSILAMAPEDLAQDRGAFFGSILGTLSHLIWGDWIWISRLDGAGRLPGSIPTSASLVQNLSDWQGLRATLDDRILDWADEVTPETLAGDLIYTSAGSGRENTKSCALCVVHMFNHQTHHRGQVHAMLTAAGVKAPVTDLIAMPSDQS